MIKTRCQLIILADRLRGTEWDNEEVMQKIGALATKFNTNHQTNENSLSFRQERQKEGAIRHFDRLQRLKFDLL